MKHSACNGEMRAGAIAAELVCCCMLFGKMTGAPAQQEKKRRQELGQNVDLARMGLT